MWCTGFPGAQSLRKQPENVSGQETRIQNHDCVSRAAACVCGFLPTSQFGFSEGCSSAVGGTGAVTSSADGKRDQGRTCLHREVAPRLS